MPSPDRGVRELPVGWSAEEEKGPQITQISADFKERKRMGSRQGRQARQGKAGARPQPNPQRKRRVRRLRRFPQILRKERGWARAKDAKFAEERQARGHNQIHRGREGVRRLRRFPQILRKEDGLAPRTPSSPRKGRRAAATKSAEEEKGPQITQISADFKERGWARAKDAKLAKERRVCTVGGGIGFLGVYLRTTDKQNLRKSA